MTDVENYCQKSISTLHAYNEVSQFFAFNFVKRKVFVLAAHSDGNPLNIQPQGLAADAWQKLLILIWKWWGSYWESCLTVLSCTCCYSLPPSLFGSWIGFPPSLSCFVLPSVLLYSRSRSPECLRMVENKIDKGSSAKLSLPFFYQDGLLFPRMPFEGYWNLYRNIRKKTANNSVVIFITQAF